MLPVTELHPPTHVTAGDVESRAPSKALSSDSPIHIALRLIVGAHMQGFFQMCPRDEKANRKQLQGCFQGSPILSGVIGVCRAVPEAAGDIVQLSLTLVLCPCREIKKDEL